MIQGCTKGLLLQGQLQVCERVTYSKELFVSNVVFYMGIRVWTSGQSLPYKTSPRGLNMTLHVLSELAIQLEQSVIPYTDALLALTLKNFCIKEATVDNFCKCKHKPLFSQKMYQLKVFFFLPYQVLPLGCTEYIPAPPIPGAIVVNVADLMQRWTADLLKSTVRRQFEICFEELNSN